jgi:hypothetical protein
MHLLPAVTDSPWQLSDKEKTKIKGTAKLKATTNFVPAQGSTIITPQPTAKKRKLEDDCNENGNVTSKIPRTSRSRTVRPKGLIWDGDNYSCAYDALFTVLFDLWKENQFMWNVNARFLKSKYLRLLGNGFLSVTQGNKTLETVRDEIRKLLHTKDRQTFPYGQIGTSLSQLALEIFSSSTKISHRQEQCVHCDFSRNMTEDDLGCVLILNTDSTVSTSYTLYIMGVFILHHESCRWMVTSGTMMASKQEMMSNLKAIGNS